ncbi:hypothetical protein DFA_09014 [Cavenderia fasciculata]|uniref:RING-type domain-containing protein n=1 Tax=Cavenderia fasciculata TaxID=261658 RepID=F4Q6G6_CACFS|nr:uncharacterized protein DFA_09014 [Cavenderia fasciculata]EGG16476.1 hypothetical protein DFA_09014 [Cavenderia fasciculata]|eukprot:XP_004354876.1 hypothetical protein DFA_09014 [Cavenderia fasciculata]
MTDIDLPPIIATLMMVKNQPPHYGKNDDISDSSGDEEYRHNKSLFKFISTLSRDLQCPVCLDLLKRPLMLSCLHSFCTSCLPELNINQSITCPVCRAITKLTEKGLDSLPVNRDLSNISDSIKRAFDFCPKFCDSCLDKRVTRKCEQCLSFLCRDCCERAHRGKNSNHNIMISSGSDFDVEHHIEKEDEPDPPAYLPFNITKKKAITIFRDWIGSLWFAPSDLNQNLTVRYVKAVYLPYWVFEACTQTNYGAYIVTGASPIPQITNSNTILANTKFEKRWSKKENIFSHRYCKSTIANEKLIDKDLLNQMNSWEVKLLGYNESMTPDPRILTLAYMVDEKNAWDTTQRKVKQLDREACEEKLHHTIPMGTYKDTFVETSIQTVASQRAFLPVIFKN